ncbi:hypothetical protein Tco_1073928 [Tanacetum coccineum]
MSRANPCALIVSEVQLVPSANRLKMTKNNQRVASDTNITDIMMTFVVGILRHHKLYKLRQPWRAILSVLNKCLTRKDTSWDIARLPILQIIWGIVHSANLDFASLIWDEFEWQVVDRTTKPSKMAKLMYTRFTKLIIDHFLSCNKSIPCRSDFDIHSKGQDLPFTKLTNTNKVTYKFRMEIPDTMIDHVFKKSAGYKYYRAKKAESEKAKAAEEPEEQHESLVRSGRGKGYMCSGDQEANVPSAFKKNVVPRKTRSLTVTDNIVEELVAVELAKSISIEEQRHQQRAIMNRLTIDRQIEKDVEDTYAEWGQKFKGLVVEDPTIQSLLDLKKGSKASRLKTTDSEATQDSYRSDTDEERDNETDDSDNSDMNLFKDEPKGDDDAVDLECSCTSEVPLGTYIDVQATNILLQEVFLDENAHHISSPPETYKSKIPKQAHFKPKQRSLCKRQRRT